MLRVLEGAAADSDSDNAMHRAKQLELLAGLDMDAWIVGRQSPPVHIWAHFCTGRPGVESITGLPRTLLDLIALASLGQDVHYELVRWEPEPELPSTGAQLQATWRCFRLATHLHLHRNGHILPASETLAAELLSAIRTSLQGHDDTEHLNPRVYIWPLYTIISITPRVQLLCAEALAALVDVLKLAGHESDPLLQVLHNAQELALTESGSFLDLDKAARDLSFELGLW